jgi:hypothetical protein
MQTFLPYSDFGETAKCLDMRRLGKQRVEAYQIIDLLEQEKAGVDISFLPWGNHPIVRMWGGYLDLLYNYYNAIVFEWMKRGYKNNMIIFTNTKRISECKKPSWYGGKEFHDGYKKLLLGKNYEFYKKYKWNV